MMIDKTAVVPILILTWIKEIGKLYIYFHYFFMISRSNQKVFFPIQFIFSLEKIVKCLRSKQRGDRKSMLIAIQILVFHKKYYT